MPKYNIDSVYLIRTSFSVTSNSIGEAVDELKALLLEKSIEITEDMISHRFEAQEVPEKQKKGRKKKNG